MMTCKCKGSTVDKFLATYPMARDGLVAGSSWETTSSAYTPPLGMQSAFHALKRESYRGYTSVDLFLQVNSITPPPAPSAAASTCSANLRTMPSLYRLAAVLLLGKEALPLARAMRDLIMEGASGVQRSLITDAHLAAIPTLLDVLYSKHDWQTGTGAKRGAAAAAAKTSGLSAWLADVDRGSSGGAGGGGQGGGGGGAATGPAGTQDEFYTAAASASASAGGGEGSRILSAAGIAAPPALRQTYTDAPPKLPKLIPHVLRAADLTALSSSSPEQLRQAAKTLLDNTKVPCWIGRKRGIPSHLGPESEAYHDAVTHLKAALAAVGLDAGQWGPALQREVTVAKATVACVYQQHPFFLGCCFISLPA
jgi:hypothetical protein